MPQIPLYNSPQTQSNALSGAQQTASAASPAAFGAMQGQLEAEAGHAGLEIGGAMARNAQQRQETQDAAEVLRIDTAQKIEDMARDSDIQKNRRGVKAAGLIDETQKYNDESLPRFAGMASNDRVRALVEKQHARYSLMRLDKISNYSDKETERALQESWQENKKATIAAGMNNPQDGVIASAIHELENRNAFEAKRSGHGADWLANENLQDSSKLHAGVLKNLLENNDTQRAAQYLEQYKNQIAPELHGSMGAAIQKNSIEADAKSSAMALFNSGLSLADAQDFVRTNVPPEQQDVFRGQVQQLYGDHKAATLAAQEGIHNDLQARINKGELISDVVKDPAFENLDPDQQAQFLRAAKAEAENRADTGRVFAKTTDFDRQDRARELIMSGGITKPEQLDIANRINNKT